MDLYILEGKKKDKTFGEILQVGIKEGKVISNQSKDITVKNPKAEFRQ